MNIGIVGLGLIGGSLAIDLKAQGYSVLGVSRQVQTCEIALKRQIVDEASIHLNLLAAADLIFICTPLAAIVDTVTHLIPHLAPATVLTDVGSAKAPIVQAVSSLWPNFVGGHPMAGTADSGIGAAQADLFVDKAYVLTPIETTPPKAVERLEKIIRALRAKPYLCRPDAHDRAVAWISHLPVFASASLIAACLDETDPETLELAQALASSGFRDTSRVGGGNPELGMMMARYNRDALLNGLKIYRDRLNDVIKLIDDQDWATLEDELMETHQARPRFVRE
ncbi:MAG: prephenate/arogenate dehydrogenase [Leptolyngbyaceae cyanobacterium bins.59]|nr:prephenate/arogenate dehydrogenase [Leptolyngbyaceae cyanobacterium bins.59]